ncbi:MAG: hypothetical protein ACK41V_23780, partial [Acidovorax sp.]|uniref:hypothetical protein n=1 Tax=Acidovorax sp. TaxID=1872122 RepID=UPI003918E1C4
MLTPAGALTRKAEAVLRAIFKQLGGAETGVLSAWQIDALRSEVQPASAVAGSLPGASGGVSGSGTLAVTLPPSHGLSRPATASRHQPPAGAPTAATATRDADAEAAALAAERQEEAECRVAEALPGARAPDWRVHRVVRLVLVDSLCPTVAVATPALLDAASTALLDAAPKLPTPEHMLDWFQP